MSAIEEIRKRFTIEVATNLYRYHPVDVGRVRSEKFQVKRFLDEYDQDVNAAYEALVKALRWKNEYGIHDRNDQYFPTEFWELFSVEISGRDKKGRWVQWEQYKNQKTFAETKELALQFIAHNLERVDRKAGQNGFILVMDFKGAGASNLDLELTKFKLAILEHYPGALREMLVCEMSWVLKPTMSLLSKMMSPKVQEMIVYVNGEDLQRYIDRGQIPVLFAGKRNNKIIPEGTKPLCEMAATYGLTDKFVDLFYKHHKLPRPDRK